MASKKLKGMKHAFIPDTQIHPASDLKHIEAAGNYLAAKQPNKIIIIGDWWDMPSLNIYDKPGSHGWEERDFRADIEIGLEAMNLFLGAVRKPRGYNPEVHFCFGNHENRMARAANDPHNRKFSSYLAPETFQLDRFKVISHPFLEIATIDGICYSHYFVSPDSLMTNAVGGTIENKLRKIGHSFSMGHQQHKQFGSVYTATGERRVGLVCGRFYPDYHEYLGPQKNAQSWSGIFLKHEVNNGDYDLLEVSMNYLVDTWL